MAAGHGEAAVAAVDRAGRGGAVAPVDASGEGGGGVARVRIGEGRDRRIVRQRRATWKMLKQTVLAFINDEALSRGAAIGFYTVTSIAPVFTSHRKNQSVRPGCASPDAR
jgi:hypothetical protein